MARTASRPPNLHTRCFVFMKLDPVTVTSVPPSSLPVEGETEVTTGRAVYVKLSPEVDRSILSLEISKDTVPFEEHEGAEHERVVVERATAGTIASPKWQEKPDPTKLDPYTTMEVPPEIGPVPGEIVDKDTEGLYVNVGGEEA